MTDREKVIKGLECCVLRDPDDSRRCAKCPKSEYGRTISNSCVNGLMAAALALLKDQEPRVMTKSEIYSHDGVMFIEDKDWSIMRGVLHEVREFQFYFMTWSADGKMNYFSHRWHGYIRKNYGKTWRCWTSRPDQATREATPWE